MQEKLLEYAELIVRVGANVQKGQPVMISCPVDCAPFARMLVKCAYEAGAKEVTMRWSDDEIGHLMFLHADDSVFDVCPAWVVKLFDEAGESDTALIHVSANDPEINKDIPSDRKIRRSRAYGKALKSFEDKQMNNELVWTIAALPTAQWAKRAFPELAEGEALEKLWEAVFTATLVGDGLAASRWAKKVKDMDSRAEILNGHDFKKLVYKNSLGTNLIVELPEKHKWVSCGEKAKNGAVFVANIPSEEIFTLPKRDGVNGVLYASKPMILQGNRVENARFVFESGKIVEVDATLGLEHLTNAIDLDEGARYLGEVALVPYHSPISEMNILFYDTLYDENASCHFAFGKAYPCFKDSDTIDEAEIKARGANDSITHEDFMVGTEDLEIVGITADGREIPVFVAGDFAF